MNSADEVEAIRSIYCGIDEFELHENGNQHGSTSFSLRLKSEAEGKNMQLTMNVMLPASYPSTLPEVSFLCTELSRDSEAALRQDALVYLEDMKGNPMILDLALWVQENATRYAKFQNDNKSSSDYSCLKSAHGYSLLQNPPEELSTPYIALFHLDHMRSKARYVKTIEKWVSELGLTGRLVFLDRLIFILLQGAEEAIKEYITLARTVSVDVDSKGRSCKERMLSVLTQEKCSLSHGRFSCFSVLECKSREEFVSIFQTNHMEDLYHEYIVGKFLR